MNLVLIIQENAFLHFIYRSMSKVVKVVPYYLFQEFLTDEKELDLKPDLDRWKICVLAPSDMKEISANPDVNESEDILLERLTTGCVCLGLKHNGAIAAYTWSNLKECFYETIFSFPLKENEAYLFDARTFKAYRGKNIAPYLRYQLYKHLAQIGRTKFYSVTIIPNTSSVVFKTKLKARRLKLYLGIKLFNKYRYNVRLKDYSTQK
jgi:hypothetical protein